MPGLVPHELRHTCASLAIASGANVLAVQRLLGHLTASMTPGSLRPSVQR
ncbi:tyrosine-type recombinase/integrase [Mycobacterium sp. ITM-2016-00318]|nr:tyrosine-type recombinase/integrase [Mycobacterium sp. ITM-2016-00318]WNG95284.1 tyrosine-type recombinase/integrase [Mycobacterium sp. ITM-2016-00318]